jgi:hypothetical protein
VALLEDAAARAAPGLVARLLGWFRRFLPSPIRVKLKDGAPCELTHPADAVGLSLRTWRLEVQNKGQATLQCLAKLEKMERTDGKPYQNSFLPIGLSTQHQRGEGRAAGPFTLRPGEPKLVEIASLNELDPNAEIELHYETDRYPRRIPRVSYRLTVGVFGGHKPRRVVCRMYVDGRGQLRLRSEA